jgi:hypothetical protein
MVLAMRTLAFAGLAAAASIKTKEQTRPVGRNVQNPCGYLGDAWRSIPAGTYPWVVDVPPSVAIECYKSVAVDKERDLALIDYLRPYVSFHSTIPLLANPPETYLIPGVDIWGGFDAIEQKLQTDGYANQYEVMNDLRSIVSRPKPATANNCLPN